MNKVFLYSSRATGIDIEEILSYIEDTFGLKVEYRGDFLYFFKSPDIARKIAQLRVVNPEKPFSRNEPLPMEIRVEEKALEQEKAPPGVIYEGFEFMKMLRSLIPPEEVKHNLLHIYITDRLLATFTDRYHLRAVILGYPCVISTSGIVEAPAKPKEFYIERRLFSGSVIKERYAGMFIDYGDPRLTEVVKGYVAMAVFYQFMQEVFCSNNKCRLYNAHWQQELIEAQLSEPEFCERHREMLKKFRGASC